MSTIPNREMDLHMIKDSKKSRVLVVGANKVGQAISQELSKNNHTVVGFIDSKKDLTSETPILGTSSELPQLIKKYTIDEVIIAETPAWMHQITDAMIPPEGQNPLKVSVVPGLYEAIIANPRMNQIDDVPLIELNIHKPSKGYRLCKRFLDIVFSLCSLTLFSPILILTAILIKLTSRGPIFYSQERVGKDGKTFKIHKFRSMIVNAEQKTGPVLSNKQDNRITPIGRILRATKLDEFPQFLDVLVGKMSVVGPRPERPCFVNDFSKKISIYQKRHSVLPGITGLAQVKGYYDSPVEIKLKYDLFYACNQSIAMDLKIAFQTVTLILAGLIKHDVPE